MKTRSLLFIAISTLLLNGCITTQTMPDGRTKISVANPLNANAAASSQGNQASQEAVPASQPSQSNPPPGQGNKTVDPARWKAAEAKVKAALECRRHYDDNDPAIRALLPGSGEEGDKEWEIVPPQGVTVFGLPVQSIRLYTYFNGEQWGYASVVPASLEAVNKAAKLRRKKGEKYTYRKTAIGNLKASPHRDQPSLTVIECSGGVEDD
ncbi:MAG: hypothetical protein LBV49_06405 [Azonexus sp.]|nr:hypothetical protein [Azonexus sp.]